MSMVVFPSADWTFPVWSLQESQKRMTATHVSDIFWKTNMNIFMINVHACSGLCSSLPEHFFRHSPDPGSSEQRNMSYVQLIRGYSPAATRRKRGWMGSISNQHSAGILADRVPLQKSSGLDHQWNYQGIRPLNSGLLKKTFLLHW